MFDRTLFNKNKFNRRIEGFDVGTMEIAIYSLEANLDSKLVIYTPLNYINDNFLGDGFITSYPLLLIHPLYPPTLTNYVAAAPYGSGIDDNKPLILIITLDFIISSEGDFEITRIGDKETNVINLKNVNLKPNQTLVIDTDLMIVTIDGIPDVSFISDDSSFFLLDDGNNEIAFNWSYVNVPSPIPAEELMLSVIWQNRWL